MHKMWSNSIGVNKISIPSTTKQVIQINKIQTEPNILKKQKTNNIGLPSIKSLTPVVSRSVKDGQISSNDCLLI